MNEDPKLDTLTRAIRTLTIAVWCLSALVFGQLAFFGWSFIKSLQWARQVTTTTTSSSVHPRLSDESARRESEMAELNGFHELPPEQMVARSSAILLTSYQDEGTRNKAVVAEVLKQEPGITLYYSVGDEYPMLSFEKQKDVTCGDGQVVFMVGKRASMGASYSFTNGRISGLGDMPLTTLRAMVKQETPARQKKS